MGYTLANQKVIINLSPSELKKTGPLYDLPMAIGVLLSMEEISVGSSETTAFLGAMSLDGGVRAVEGMLPAVLAAKKLGVSNVYMPFDPDLPALELKGLEIIYISTLVEVIQHLSGQNILPFYPQPPNISGITAPRVIFRPLHHFGLHWISMDVATYFQKILTGFNQLSFIPSLKNMAICLHPLVQVDGKAGM
jgi:hypothetical protein